MMYEDLIKRLRELQAITEHCDEHSCFECENRELCDKHDNKTVSGTYKEAADAIENLDYIEEMIRLHEAQRQNLITLMNEEPEPEWIPVTERLPSYGDWVLGIGPQNGYYVCEYRGMSHFVYGGDSPWFSSKGKAVNITHWMPLPEPPKEET